MIPGAHRLGVFPIEQSTPGKRTQKTDAHLGLNFGDGFWTDTPGFVKVRAACGISLENEISVEANAGFIGVKRSGRN